MTISQMKIKISKRDYARGGGGPRGIVPRAHFFRLSLFLPISLSPLSAIVTMCRIPSLSSGT